MRYLCCRVSHFLVDIRLGAIPGRLDIILDIEMVESYEESGCCCIGLLFEREFMPRTIIIGYGNIDRSDDGVACEIINLVRQNLGQKILEDGDMGLENLDGEIDSIFLPQLVPEIMELITGYEQIIFVDAHTGDDMEDLNCSKVIPRIRLFNFYSSSDTGCAFGLFKNSLST